MILFIYFSYITAITNIMISVLLPNAWFNFIIGWALMGLTIIRHSQLEKGESKNE